MVTATGPRYWSLLRDAPRGLLILLLKVYRRIVSPLYGPVCRFYPSCSAYALEAVTVHGALRGSTLAVKRVLRCHPWNDGGVDHVPEGGRIFPDGKVPAIVVLNHPVIPDDDEGRLSGSRS
ncbi:membrane protein insertion efficiency factor YidD [Arthrobacter sp. MSA 4-2]|uniref:membrane protein insertion efficiency factor YidD n=1 Tax=Arthrobacter sp. MSA 4-2 TaxID=2794349 RepID=UPI0018E6E435|nr:membrane protein insertion efficiency factor YidD [Arthrobacter sp. MSA 4-2]MBJ2121784.1 membrane protein insertion efficiency factor YidD [Arthrobacter sp. MSA 4-2]